MFFAVHLPMWLWALILSAVMFSLTRLWQFLTRKRRTHMTDTVVLTQDESWLWDPVSKLYIHEDGSQLPTKPPIVQAAELRRNAVREYLCAAYEKLRNDTMEQAERDDLILTIRPLLGLPHLSREGTNWSDLRGALRDIDAVLREGPPADATERHGIVMGPDNSGGGNCLFLSISRGDTELASLLRAATVQHVYWCMRNGEPGAASMLTDGQGRRMRLAGTWAEVDHCAVIAQLIQLPIHVWHTEGGKIMCNHQGGPAYSFAVGSAALPKQGTSYGLEPGAVHLVHVQKSFKEGVHFREALLHGVRTVPSTEEIQARLYKWYKKYRHGLRRD